MKNIMKPGTTAYYLGDGVKTIVTLKHCKGNQLWSIEESGVWVHEQHLEVMHYFLVYLFNKSTGRIVESGWMMAASPMELIENARSRHLDIDITYKGQADLSKFACEIFE